MTAATKLHDVRTLFAWTRFINYAPLRWVALTLAVAIAIATAARSYHNINNELTTVALSRREAVAQLMAATLTEKFGRSTDVATSLSSNMQFRNLVTEKKWGAASKILRNVPHDFSYIERLLLTDAAGVLQADVLPRHGMHSEIFVSRDWLQQVSRNGQPAVSAVYTRREASSPTFFAVAAPIKNMTGQAMGVLVLQIRVEYLLEWVAEIDMGTAAFFYIVDSKQQLAFHSQHWNRQQIIDLSATPMVQKMRHAKLGVEIGFDTAEQSESIITYATLPDYGWGVVAQQPTRSSLDLAARDTQLRQLLAGYSLLLLFGAITAILALRIAGARQRAEIDRRIKANIERHNTELQAVNQELEAFCYSVSHDLRAPLRGIDGFSRTLLDKYSAQLDARGQHYLQRIRVGTQRMGQLIDDLLNLSRVTRHNMSYSLVNLSVLAHEIAEELHATKTERDVMFRIQADIQVQCDAHLLQIVLQNLLANAWKFSAKHAQAIIEFGLTQQQGENVYFVRDDGAGFDMAYADKLFGAFQRLHDESEFEGIGVGLATVQRIIHRHGGRIWAQGALEQGATFYFTLPKRRT